MGILVILCNLFVKIKGVYRVIFSKYAGILRNMRPIIKKNEFIFDEIVKILCH
jgi:hypothetical protein